MIPARDYSLGFLEQEPQLDPEKTVKQVISEAVQPVLDMLAEFDRINEGFADPDLSPDDMEKLIAKQAAIQEKLEEMDAWNLDNRLETAMEALRCPPADASVTHPLRRRKKARGPVPPAAAGAGHPAARRADQPPGRRIGAVAGAPSAGIQGNGHRRHP